MSKKWLALALKFLVSGLLIWFLARQIDVGDVGARLAALDPVMVAAGVAVLFVQVFVGGARWATVLDAIGRPFGWLRATRLFYIGIFFSQALPSSVGGDAVRMYKTYREGLGLRAAVNGVILERAVTVVALVVLVLALQPWFLERVDSSTAAVLIPGIALVALAAATGLVFLLMLDRLPQGLRRWRLVRGLGNLGIDARAVFLSPRFLPRAMAWGLLTHVNVSLCAFLLAMGLDLDVGWFDCLVLVPPVLLIMTLPISIGGWGVREQAMVVMFGLIGVPKEGAVALSVLFGLVGIGFAIPGGVVWLLTRDRGESLEFETPDLAEANQPAPADGPDT